MNPVTGRPGHARIAAGLNLKSGPTRINKKMPNPPKAEKPKDFTPKALDDLVLLSSLLQLFTETAFDAVLDGL